MENSSEFFYEKLKTAEKPGTILATMYCLLYEIPVTKSEIIMFNKLIKVFGRFTVFFAIIDASGSYEDRIEKPYPLLYTICKRKFEASHPDATIQSRESLEPFIADLDKSIAKMQKSKIKIPSSEGL